VKLDDIRRLAETLPRRELANEHGSIYLVRYRLHGWMPDAQERTPCSVYLHNILRADSDDAPHTHPWEWFQSTILHGGYTEERGANAIQVGYAEGDTNSFDSVREYHRIVGVQPDTWTLVVVGPKAASWGFMVPGRGLVPWRDRLRERGIKVDYPETPVEAEARCAPERIDGDARRSDEGDG
jgi:hypothetical protein